MTTLSSASLEQIFEEIRRRNNETPQKKPKKSIIESKIFEPKDILIFFTTLSRAENDSSNNLRELIIKNILNLPANLLEDSEYGTKWVLVRDNFISAIKKISKDLTYTSYSINIKKGGGRSKHYDINIEFYNNEEKIHTSIIEFKYNCSSISNLPQFLSLPAKEPIFTKTYDRFYYDNYLAKYIECDNQITESIPTIEKYIKLVQSNISKEKIPFFKQLRDKESTNQEEKATVVNNSIKDYLYKYGKNIDIQKISNRFIQTQKGKVYFLWKDGEIIIEDGFTINEMSNLEYIGIKNDNILQLKSGNIIYSMLLRWRNNKGILTPAWQISVKKIAVPTKCKKS